MKRICLFLLILAIVSLPVFARGSSASSVDATELRIMIRNIGMAPTNDNIIHQELERRTGFKLNFELKPSASYNAASNTVIASGDYPDAMEYWSTVYPTELQQFADDGVIRPVDDLIARYGSEFTPEVRPSNYWFVSNKDNKRYAIPMRYSSYGTSNAIILRKDWLDMLGLNMPKNSDEYFNVLTAFAQNAERLVGQNRRFAPHGTWNGAGCFLSYIMSENSMIRGWNWVDGNLVHYANMPAYRNVLQTARRFYQAGLIEPEYPILLNRDDAMNRMAGNQYGAWDWYTTSFENESLSTRLYDALPELKNNLAFIPYFADKTGTKRFIQNTPRQQMLIFEKTPEEKAINLVKLFNYMISKEGAYLIELGLEGEHYTIDSSGNVIVPDLTPEMGARLGIWNYSFTMRRDNLPIAISDYLRDFMTTETSASYGIESPVPYGRAWQQYGIALNEMINQYETELITRRDINFDAAFNELTNTWYTSGGTQVTQEMNELYGRR